jgi:polyisoprenoid-binding protein YceI
MEGIMQRNFRIIAGVVVVVAVVSIGTFLYLTRDITAPTQAVQDTAEQLATNDNSGSQIVFRISQDESQVEYNIFEVLNGADKTVVGTTSQVAGDILVNLDEPAQSEIGDIQINARTFATDETRRDNSVARFILQSESDANEFITFSPTSLSGLPDNIQVGDTVTFQITGNLTIAGTTQSVTFDVNATLESDNRLVGQAESTVLRSDYNLTIPDVPFVANVGDEITLRLNLVANAVTEA